MTTQISRAHIRFLKWAALPVLSLGLLGISGCSDDPIEALAKQQQLAVEADLNALERQATPQNTLAIIHYLGEDGVGDDLKQASKNVESRAEVFELLHMRIEPELDAMCKTRRDLDEIFPAMHLTPPTPTRPTFQ